MWCLEADFPCVCRVFEFGNIVRAKNVKIGGVCFGFEVQALFCVIYIAIMCQYTKIYSPKNPR